MYCTKDLLQGKLFQSCTHLMYCSELSLGGNVNIWWVSKPEMGSIFHINNQWNIMVIGNYYVNIQNYQNSMLLTSTDTKRTLRHIFSCLQIPPRENWFQYVRRVYATANNFPCISTLGPVGCHGGQRGTPTLTMFRGSSRFEKEGVTVPWFDIKEWIQIITYLCF